MPVGGGRGEGEWPAEAPCRRHMVPRVQTPHPPSEEKASSYSSFCGPLDTNFACVRCVRACVRGVRAWRACVRVCVLCVCVCVPNFVIATEREQRDSLNMNLG